MSISKFFIIGFLLVTLSGFIEAGGDSSIQHKSIASPYLARSYILEIFEVAAAQGSVMCGTVGSKNVPGSMVKGKFVPFSKQISTLSKQARAATGTKKKKMAAKITKLKALLAKNKNTCSDGTKPPSSVPGTPTPKATATPPSGGGSSYFDAQGNLTAMGKTKFGVPSNLSGNISSGGSRWAATCTSCHAGSGGEKLNRNFATISLAAKFYAPNAGLTQGDIANITAYLNRFQKP